MAKIVVAIGGNALGNNPEEQKLIVKNTAKHLVDFIEQNNDLIIVHGNGPQVGMINNGFEVANKTDEKNPIVDFPECGAMSQGYIGYHLQQAITNELNIRKIKKSVASIVTQTLVDKNDLAFKDPTKPIGSFMDEQTAKKMASLNNWNVKEDAGRGWRRVIASPKPISIIEKNMISKLVDDGFILIAAGGGGVPVIEENNFIQGVAAVIDKDFAAAKIAELCNADSLIILTAVDRVLINYNKANQSSIKEMNIKLAEQYILENQFASGSMLPKVQAAMAFVKSSNGKPAYIGSLDKVAAVLKGESGTKITK
ncbi:carbamate kinase [Mesoplasma entomophilum]|uniref:Carbamate kinase n=1 Tax=Mesoplasma entomophilum TaxID=2149 RepID=A0A3S5Y081_9MOLU|nr:carbamate kinase [Mesoplasma entomophilum]ATQ35579.1 carbamate kinase [Mesoplasma entomophilum]ATZ19545.1 carbamate kinase [Mesoplasma entomophilum]